MEKKIISCILSVIFVMSLLSHTFFAKEEINLTDEQEKSIMMLNYLAVLTQEINKSKNSRLYLEDAYSSLIGNTNPNAVDYTTQDYLLNLLDDLEAYRMATVKRERLEYVYDQNQARMIKAAIPNPLGLLSSIQSADRTQLISAIAYMAVDSASSYLAAKEEVENEYMQSDWQLTDEEQAVLDKGRKQAFEYLLNISHEYDLPDYLTFSEDTVEKYVSWKNHSNNVQKIQFFEENVDTYRVYGDYWLTLASAYYESGDYLKCIEAVKTYQNMDLQIFRLDHDFAKVLPLAIVSAEEIQEGTEYFADIETWLGLLEDNTSEDDWSLLYFAAQTYLDLYKITNNVAYCC